MAQFKNFPVSQNVFNAQIKKNVVQNLYYEIVSKPQLQKVLLIYVKKREQTFFF